MDSSAARWVGALTLLGVFGGLIALAARERAGWDSGPGLGWSPAVLAAAALSADSRFAGSTAMRNAQGTSVAPTGTISLIAGTTETHALRASSRTFPANR